MCELKKSIVNGWGAVEKEAASWHPDATIKEIAPRLWEVKVSERVIGYIGKEPWSINGIDMELERSPAGGL